MKTEHTQQFMRINGHTVIHLSVYYGVLVANLLRKGESKGVDEL